MATKHDLVDWLHEALQVLGGAGTIPNLCRQVWENHESDLKASGDLFYTWQYDIRWAAYQLRQSGTMKSDKKSRKGIRELA